MNTSPIKLRRDADYCSLYHIRSGLRVVGLPEGYTVASEIGRLPEGYWVDTHVILDANGERVDYAESLSDDGHFTTLSDLRFELERHQLVWKLGQLRMECC